MCAAYGVCKVNKRQNVTFRHIIEQYKKQPGASPRTFREVRMREPTDEPQDIIQFYNTLFIPAMKDHLIRQLKLRRRRRRQPAAAAAASPAPAAAAPPPP